MIHEAMSDDELVCDCPWQTRECLVCRCADLCAALEGNIIRLVGTDDEANAALRMLRRRQRLTTDQPELGRLLAAIREYDHDAGLTERILEHGIAMGGTIDQRPMEGPTTEEGAALRGELERARDAERRHYATPVAPGVLGWAMEVSDG